VLRASGRSVWIGGQLRLRGRVRGQIPAGARVRLQVLTKGNWRRFGEKPVEANGRFTSWPRLGRGGHASGHGHRVLRLGEQRLRSSVRMLRIRAVVRGAGRSRILHIRVHRRH
jgi:hypothetical protein